MNKLKQGILGDIASSLGSVAKQTGKQVVKLPTDIAKEAVEQTAPAVGTGEEVQKQKSSQAESHKEETKNIVADLYEKSGPEEKSGKNEVSQVQSKNPQKSPEELQQIEALKQRLHSQYYQKLVNPPKQQEERPAEKVEKEKQEEQFELREKEKKKPKPLAVTQAQNKTEMHRGAAG